MKEYREPTPTYMSKDQMTSYLKDLRKPLPRPAGSRPPPPSKFGSLRRAEAPATVEPVDIETACSDERPALGASNSMPSIQSSPTLSHRRTESALSQRSMSRSPFAGRPLARAPSATTEPSLYDPDRAQHRRTPSIIYMENGLRWMEKQETRSLRQALDDMDMEEERRVHHAAQDEAAELVWKHQNPEAATGPFANPDVKRDYRSHLRRGSYHRSHSQGEHSSADSRSASEGSQTLGPSDGIALSEAPQTTPVPRRVSPPTGEVSVQKRRVSSGKSYDQLAQAVAKDIAIAHRRVSSGSKRILSGEKKKFMDPNDRIWEDPEEGETPQHQHDTTKRASHGTASSVVEAVPSYVRRNPFARVRAQYEKNLERSTSAPTLQTLHGAPIPRHDRVEIQRNPPSQSRNAFYTSNEVVLPPASPAEAQHEADEVAPKGTPTKDGKEVRGDDIRAATSKPRSAYSPNLPRPTMVSDKPGRPIVSFQKDYKPKEIVLEEQHVEVSPMADRPPESPVRASPDMAAQGAQSRGRGSPFARRTIGENSSQSGSPRQLPESPTKSRIPQINLDDMPKWDPSKQPPRPASRGSPTPSVPTICVPDEPSIPTISLPEDAVPSMQVEHSPAINVSESPSSSPTRMSRAPQSSSQPSHSAAAPGRPLPRHANTTPVVQSKSTPHYTPSIRQSGALCAHCALPIAGRILSAAGERFHPGCFVCHQCNTNLELVAFYPEPEKHRAARFQDFDGPDADPTLRFYCHLDFHELFSPRCKSCKTPIEGEVIMACGAEWHVGHFFCAQCGDPFDSRMPFVEKEGYAWCVNCHTNRYSSKCRKCRKPVTDVVVKALGSDWHSDCFTCMECNGAFADGRYFLRGDSQDPVCVQCEEKRLKA